MARPPGRRQAEDCRFHAPRGETIRSIAILLPFLVHGAMVLQQRWPRAGWKILSAVAVLNLVLPASHVVQNHLIPIRSVWAQVF